MALPTPVLLALASLPLQEPAFVEGDVGELRARVVSADEIVKKEPGTLLWIEVTNAGSASAEPTAFRLTPRGKGAAPLEVARVGPPTFGRAGRSVAPRKKLRYPVVVPLECDVAKKAEVEVLDASFLDGVATVVVPPVAVGEVHVEERRDEVTGQRVTTSTVHLANESDVPVDLVFLATFAGARKGEGLLFATLAAGEERDVRWDAIPFDRAGNRALHGVEVEALELVDWSSVHSDGRDLAGELLSAAWAGRAHLAPERLALGAPCEVTLKGHNEVSRAACRLGFDAAGAWVVLDPGELEGGALSELRKYLRRVPCPVAERAFPGTDEGARVVKLGAPTVLELGDASKQGRYVGLVEGAVAFVGGSPDGTGLVDRWTTRRERQGWLLEHVETHGNSVGNARADLHWSWRRDGEEWWPERFRLVNAGNHLWPERFELDFGAWSR